MSISLPVVGYSKLLQIVVFGLGSASSYTAEPQFGLRDEATEMLSMALRCLSVSLDLNFDLSSLWRRVFHTDWWCQKCTCSA